MTKKRTDYEGDIDDLNFSKIYLNVNYMDKGKYEIVITYNNKIIKTINFTLD